VMLHSRHPLPRIAHSAVAVALAASQGGHPAQVYHGPRRSRKPRRLRNKRIQRLRGRLEGPLGGEVGTVAGAKLSSGLDDMTAYGAGSQVTQTADFFVGQTLLGDQLADFRQSGRQCGDTCVFLFH